MRWFTSSAIAAIGLLGTGCMFLPGYDFSKFKGDDTSSSGEPAASGGGAPSAGASDSSGAGGAPGSMDSSTSTSGSGGAAMPPLYDNIKLMGGVTTLAADDTFLYWSSKSPQNASNAVLYRGGVNGGTPESLETGLPAIVGLAVDATMLYWLQNTPKAIIDAELYGRDKNGVKPKYIHNISAPGQGFSLFKVTAYLTSSNMIYTVGTDQTNFNSCTANPNGPIIADGTHVYWIDKVGIRSIPVNTFNNAACMGAPTLGNSDKVEVSGIALALGTLYWTAKDGNLYSIRTDASTSGTLYEGSAAEPLMGIFLDGSIAYLTTPKSLIKFDLNTTKKLGTVLDGLHTVVGIAANATAVFVADEDSAAKTTKIYRIAK